MSQPTTITGENQEDLKNHASGNEPEDTDNDDLDQDEDDPNDDFIEGFDPDKDLIDEDEEEITIKRADFEKLKKGIDNAKTNIRQKKHFRAKYRSLLNPSNPKSMSTTSSTEENKTTTPSTTTPSVEPTATTPVQSQPNDLEKKVDVISLMSSNSYLDKETADEIVNRSKKLGITIEEVMNDKFFKPFLEEKKKNWEIEHASSHPSTSTTSSINTGNEEIDWKNAPRDVVDKKLRDMQRGGRR